MATSKLNTDNTISIVDLDAMLGNRPILPSEDPVAYDKLTAQFRSALEPQDIIEEILVRDAIDLTWEIQRLKDFKRQLLHAEREDSLKKLLEKFLGFSGYDRERFEKWKDGDKEAIKAVNDFLRGKGLDPSAIDSFSFKMHLDNMERFDRLIMQAEARRLAHLREVDRHRAAMAIILRNTISAIEDGKTIEHEPKPKPTPTPKPTSKSNH
jgi:hypothetical protein